MKSIKVLIIAACILIVAITYVLVAGNNMPNTLDNSVAESANESKIESTHKSEEAQLKISASWAGNYSDIESLTNESDFIGLIEIVDVVNILELGDEEFPTPFTTFSAKVLSGVLADKDIIDVVMTGRRDGANIFEIADDPLMSSGETWFIFARKNDLGSYTILGGPTGRFSYDKDNSTITSLALVDLTEYKPAPGEIIGICDAKLSDIENEIKTYLTND